MSKRKRQVDQRLNELFSTADQPEAPEPQTRATRAARSIGVATTIPAELLYVTAAIDKLPLPAYVKDREHTWVAVNAAFAQLIGHAPEALLGHTDKEQADDAWQLDDRVLDNGHAEDSQEATTLPDGTIRTRRTHRTPLLDAKQETRYVMGVVEEGITPAPGAHTHAPESAETFHAAMDAIPSPVIISRVSDDVIVYANQAFSTFTAVPLAQLIGQRAAQFYADLQDRDRIVQGVRQHDELHGFEVRMRRADGAIFWVSLSIRRLKFNDETCVITTLEDISIRKQAEEDLVKFKLGIDRSYYSVMITATDGTILYVNPAFTKIYGYTADEAVGRKPSILKSGAVTSEQYTRFWTMLLAGEIVTGEIINKTKDGRLIPVETNNSPILDESGQIIGFVSMQSDISARKQAEEDLVTRNRQLATFNRVGQELAQLVTAQEVVEHVFEAIGEVFDNRNLYVALYDERKQEISFPIYTMGGERRTVAGRPFGNGITEHVLSTKKVLWIPRKVQEFAASIGVASIGRPSQCYLGVPLLSGDKALGVIAVQDYEHEEVYTTADVELLSAIAAQTAAALENVRLYAAESRRALQLQTAAEISTAAGTVLNVDELLPFVVNLIQQRFNLYYVGLFLIDETQQNAVLRAGTGEVGQHMLERQHQLALDDRSMIGWSIQHRVPRIALDVGEDAVRFNNPDLPDTRSELALPLVSRDLVLGAMTVQSTEAAAFTDQDVAILQTMSDQVATAIANAQLFEQVAQARQQAEARLRETQFLQSVGQAVSSSLDLSAVLDMVMGTLQGELGFTHNALYLVDKETGVVSTPRASGTATQLQGLTRSLEQLKSDILVDILKKGQIEVIDGWDDRLDRTIYEAQGHAALVRAFVPLRLRGESIGLLEVGYQRTERTRITPEEVRLLSGLADQIAIAVENARLLEQSQIALAETTRRSEQLDVLNEMARALGSTLNADTILSTVYTYTSRLMDTQSFFIALYDNTANIVSFPLSYSYNDSRPVQVESRPLKSGLTDYVIRHHQPLLLAEDIPAGMAKLGLEFIAFGNAQPALSWLGVPMVFGEQVLGAIVVQSITTPGLYREHERDLLLAVAGQAAIALNNARLFEESQQRITELAVVNEISRTLTVAQNVQQLFATIHQQVGRLYDAANFYIATYDGGEEWSLDYQFEHGQLLPPARHKLGGGFTSYILQTRQPILIRSQEDNAVFHDQQNLPRIGETAKSWMGVPLIVGGTIIGVMGIQSYEQERLYSEHDVALFSTIGTQAAAAIANARLFQEARLRATELTALNELSQTLASQLNVNQVLNEVWQGVSRLLDTTNFYIALYDRERGEISFPINASESTLDKEIEVMPADQGLTGHIIRTRQPLLIAEDTDRHVKELGLENIGGTSQSYLGVPLILGDEVLGVMAIQSYTRARLYNEHDQNLMLAIAGQAAIALQNARLFEQTQKQSRETVAINEILQVVSQRRNLDSILETAYRHIHELVPSDACIVAMYDASINRLWYPLIYDNDQRFPLREGDISSSTNISQVITSGEPVLIHRTPQDIERIGGGGVAALGNLDRPSASLLYVPLNSERRVIGALSVQSYQINAYTTAHVSLLTRIANQLGVAVQNIRLFEQIQQNAGQLAALNALGQAVSQQIEVEQVLETAYRQLQPLVPLDTFFAVLHDQHSNTISLPVVYDEGKRYIEPDGPFNSNSSTGKVILTGEPILKLVTTDELAAMTEVKGALGNVTKPSLSLLYVPLKVGALTFGVLSIQSYQLSAYNQDTVQLMGNVANQVAIAIQNAQHFTRTQAALAETAQLYAASQHLTAATNLQEAVVAMAEGIPVTDINRAVLWLFERDEQDQVVAAIVSAGWHSGQGTPLMPMGTRLSTEVIKAMPLVLTADPIFSNDLQTDQRIDPTTAALLQRQQIGAIAILPLWVAGRQIGAFLLEAEGPHTFTDTEIRPYVSLSQQLAATIYNQQLLEQTQQSSRQLTVLNELGQAISQQIEIEQILEVTYQRLQLLFSVDAFLTVLHDPDTNTISFPIIYDEGRRYVEPTLAFNPQSVTGQVILTGDSILRLLTPEQLTATAEVKGAVGNESRPSASLIYVPLKIGTRTIGVLSIQSYQLNAYDNDTVQFVSSIANHVAIAIQNARLFNEARARAQREQTLREITSRVRNSTDPDTIARTAVRELGIALGRRTFIRLGAAEQLSRPPQTDREEMPASGDGQQTSREGGQ